MRGVGAGGIGGRRDLTGETLQFKGRNKNQVVFGCGDSTDKLIAGNWYVVASHDFMPMLSSTLTINGVQGNFDAALFRKKTDYKLIKSGG